MSDPSSSSSTHPVPAAAATSGGSGGARTAATAQEEEFQRKHGKLPAGNAVAKHLMRRDRKYFDSGDWNMVKAQNKNQANVIAKLPKRGLSPQTSPKESPQTSPRNDASAEKELLDLQEEAAMITENAESAAQQLHHQHQ
eukprot:ANDGO_02783.mRNA.1 hypothetical protein SARC_06479